jgi:hypothetical protein
MNFQEIYDLTEYIPRNSRYFGTYRSEGSTNRSFEVSRFSICYSDLSFLWHFVKSYTDTNTPLPTELPEFVDHTSYELIDRVYDFEVNGARDEELAHAISLDRGVPIKYKHTIQACMLSEDMTYEALSKLTSRPIEVLELYGKLFFDVMDRQTDEFFIANIVYPETRLVEIDPDYITNVSYDDLMKRTARMGGVADVLSLAGINPMIHSGQTQAMASSFENKMMANADFMARIGALNSRHSAGINNAKNLLAAAKHGGDTDTQSSDMLSALSMGASIIKEISDSEQRVLEDRRDYQAQFEEAELETSDS